MPALQKLSPTSIRRASLHPPKDSVQRPWVECLEAKLYKAFHELVAIATILPEHHQRHRHQPVLGPSFDVTRKPCRGRAILGSAVLIAHMRAVS